jgi:stringent starvation protein B
MVDRAPEKQERLTAALARGMTMIHLDARCEGVRVPPHLSQEAHLRLNLSHRFDPPDLVLSGWGVRETLSFMGRRFPVCVPWSAVFAIYCHETKEFWLYPEDMPPELMERSPAAAPATPPQLRPVSSEAEPPRAEAEGGEPRASRRHLRVVK